MNRYKTQLSLVRDSNKQAKMMVKHQSESCNRFKKQGKRSSGGVKFADRKRFRVTNTFFHKVQRENGDGAAIMKRLTSFYSKSGNGERCDGIQ